MHKKSEMFEWLLSINIFLEKCHVLKCCKQLILFYENKFLSKFIPVIVDGLSSYRPRTIDLRTVICIRFRIQN